MLVDVSENLASPILRAHAVPKVGTYSPIHSAS